MTLKKALISTCDKAIDLASLAGQQVACYLFDQLHEAKPDAGQIIAIYNNGEVPEWRVCVDFSDGKRVLLAHMANRDAAYAPLCDFLVSRRCAAIANGADGFRLLSGHFCERLIPSELNMQREVPVVPLSGRRHVMKKLHLPHCVVTYGFDSADKPFLQVIHQPDRQQSQLYYHCWNDTVPRGHNYLPAGLRTYCYTSGPLAGEKDLPVDEPLRYSSSTGWSFDSHEPSAGAWPDPLTLLQELEVSLDSRLADVVDEINKLRIKAAASAPAPSPLQRDFGTEKP